MINKSIKSTILKKKMLTAIRFLQSIYFLNNSVNYRNYHHIVHYSELNLTYNLIFKSGQSNITKLFYDIYEFNALSKKNIIGREGFRYTFTKEAFDNKFNRKFQNSIDQSFKFTFVRNPYSRALSMFRHKIIKDKFLEKIEFDDNKTGFNEFLNLLLHNPKTFNNDYHFISQTDSLAFHVSNFDYIGKLENFCDDFHRILNINLIDYDDFISNRIRNKRNSKHQTFSESALNSYYNKENIRLVNVIFEKDFYNFDYIQNYF